MVINLKVPDKIILMLSGGLDSAILLYCICKYYPQTIIVTATGKNIHVPYDAEKAKDILSFIENEFPENNIIKNCEYDLDPKNKEWLEKAKDWKNTRFHSHQSLSQHMQQVHELEKIKLDTQIYDFMNGTTANPPVEIDGGMPARVGKDLPEVIETSKNVRMHLPWANKDKKYIAKIYKDEGLMESLFKLTRSCIGTNLNECGKCFWCLEKHWGFQL